jgi:hemerythrin
MRHHFATEERLMRRWPGTVDEAHRREHQRLLQVVRRLTPVVNEQSVALTLRYLQTWLFRHMGRFDSRIGDLATD